MAKYHISKNGTPAKCTAKTRPCPCGGADAHFDSKEDCQKVIDKNNSTQHGVLPEDPAMEKLMQGSSSDRLKAARKGYGLDRLARDPDPEVAETAQGILLAMDKIDDSLPKAGIIQLLTHKAINGDQGKMAGYAASDVGAALIDQLDEYPNDVVEDITDQEWKPGDGYYKEVREAFVNTPKVDTIKVGYCDNRCAFNLNEMDSDGDLVCLDTTWATVSSEAYVAMYKGKIVGVMYAPSDNDELREFDFSRKDLGITGDLPRDVIEAANEARDSVANFAEQAADTKAQWSEYNNSRM